MKIQYALLITCIIGVTIGCMAKGDLSFEDGAKSGQKTKLSSNDRIPVRRWTFDLSDKAEFVDFISGEVKPIRGYGTSIDRVEGRTVTSDEIRTPLALSFDGQSFVSCGRVPEWKAQVNRTMAFYVKKAPGDQPHAVLFHQEGKQGPAVHIALGPKGDGTDLVARFGSAVWEGTLSEPIRDGVWTHLIATMGWPGIRVHVDTHENPLGSRGTPVEASGALYMGGAPDQPCFGGAIDDVRLWNITHQGIYFVMPRYQIALPNPNAVKRTGDDWYRGKAVALRFTWNQFLYGDNWKERGAGEQFRADELADLAVESGACGVLMKMRAPDGFPAFPSALNREDDRPDRDFAGELVQALKKRMLWFAPNLSQENIDAMARQMKVSKAESYRRLVSEIFDRYEIPMYQFRFDGFWGQGETYDPADYEHQKVWEVFRNRHPETLINLNRFSGHGAEDMADIETSRPADQVHYWEQEDFSSLLKCRNWDWAVEVETPLGDDWGSGGPLTAIPSHYLLNKVSALSAMGITTVIGFGADVEGRLTRLQKETLREIGEWLVPRKPFLDDARPLHEARVEGYDGLWYVNRVKSGVTVNLLSGSRLPVKLPPVLKLKGIGPVKRARLVPVMKELPIQIDGDAIKISLKQVEQDTYNTIILFE